MYANDYDDNVCPSRYKYVGNNTTTNSSWMALLCTGGEGEYNARNQHSPYGLMHSKSFSCPEALTSEFSYSSYGANGRLMANHTASDAVYRRQFKISSYTDPSAASLIMDSHRKGDYIITYPYNVSVRHGNEQRPLTDITTCPSMDGVFNTAFADGHAESRAYRAFNPTGVNSSAPMEKMPDGSPLGTYSIVPQQ